MSAEFIRALAAYVPEPKGRKLPEADALRAMKFAWVLNLDAELELSRLSFEYVPRTKLAAAARALRPRLARALGPGGRAAWSRAARCRRGDFVGRAWCPTPLALARTGRRGSRARAAPGAASVLRRVNHRLFAHQAGGGLPRASLLHGARAARGAAPTSGTAVAAQAAVGLRGSRADALLRADQRQAMVVAGRVFGPRRPDRRAARHAHARGQPARLRLADGALTSSAESVCKRSASAECFAAYASRCAGELRPGRVRALVRAGRARRRSTA